MPTCCTRTHLSYCIPVQFASNWRCTLITIRTLPETICNLIKSSKPLMALEFCVTNNFHRFLAGIISDKMQDQLVNHEIWSAESNRLNLGNLITIYSCGLQDFVDHLAVDRWISWLFSGWYHSYLSHGRADHACMHTDVINQDRNTRTRYIRCCGCYYPTESVTMRAIAGEV